MGYTSSRGFEAHKNITFQMRRKEKKTRDGEPLFMNTTFPPSLPRKACRPPTRLAGVTPARHTQTNTHLQLTEGGRGRGKMQEDISVPVAVCSLPGVLSSKSVMSGLYIHKHIHLHPRMDVANEKQRRQYG